MMRSTARVKIGLLSVAVVALAGAVRAQEGRIDPGFPARCWMSEVTARQVSVFLRACNNTGEDIFGITASPLTVSTTGTVDFEYQTLPAWRREMDDGNCHTMKWQLLLQCGGRLSIAADATAETPDGETINTGRVQCGVIDLPCAPATPTRTPIERATLRPTRTPLASPTPKTPAPSPTRRPTFLVPTNTPRPDVPLHTRAPTATPRPRRNTPTPRTPIVFNTKTPRTPLNTPTPKPRIPTQTLRPTRTPIPTRTPGPIIAELFSARCVALNPDADTVTVFLQLFNNSGGSVFNIVPEALEIDTTGTAVVTSLRGPFPPAIGVLFDRHSSRFQWTLTHSGEGQIILHARASGTTEDGRIVVFGDGSQEVGPVVIDTGRRECNIINVPARVTP